MNVILLTISLFLSVGYINLNLVICQTEIATSDVFCKTSSISVLPVCKLHYFYAFNFDGQYFNQAYIV